MKIIIAPDKFKGSLTSFEACSAIVNGILQINNEIEIFQFPMADGGDGFAAVLKHYTSSSDIMCHTKDPLGKEMDAAYQWNETNKTAIIELAAASGLVLLHKYEQNPLHTSTYGTGLQIKNAIDKGAERVILGLGGSATNDAGTGILAALGFQFYDINDQLLLPAGKNLLLIEKITPPSFIPSVKFEIACDVQNKMHGQDGAAYTYAAQKGANDKEIKQLDEGLNHFAFVLKKQTGKSVSEIPGTGAAGAVAAGLICFFDVSLKEGTKMIIDSSNVEKELKNANLLITGEGKLDKQSKEGKVVGAIAKLGAKYQVPVIACCGIADLNKNEAREMGLQDVFSLAENKNDINASIKNAKELLQQKIVTDLPSIIAGLSGNRSL